jgi:alpha,alpha-trehalose phosphorylase
MMDLANLERNTRDGLHIASLAGTWTALTAGFGGMRHHGDALFFAPRLPEQISRLAFAVQFRQRCVRVDISHQQATYTLLAGTELEIHHHGSPLTVTKDAPCSGPLPAIPDLPEPQQPPSRGPARRRWAGQNE